METLNKVAMSPTGWDSRENYIGSTNFNGWYVVLGRNRDSDTLSESNWEAALEMLGGESRSVQIFRFGHWACGWIEYLCVRGPHYAQGLEIEKKLEGYPVLDDDDFSEREASEWQQGWEDWGYREFCRELVKQFELSDGVVNFLESADKSECDYWCSQHANSWGRILDEQWSDSKCLIDKMDRSMCFDLLMTLRRARVAVA